MSDTDEAGYTSGVLFTGYHGSGEEQQERLALSFAAELRELTTWTEVDRSDPAGRSLFRTAGFDRRYDDDGNPRPVQEVVREVHAACRH